MARPQPLQHFLDALLPAMQARARDGNSPASLDRIAAALNDHGAAGAAPAVLPVCSWLDTAWAYVPDEPDLAAVMAALRDLAPLLCWRKRSGDDTASANFPDNHANAMLLGPGGIEVRHDLWIGLSLIAPDTRYPDHRHAPEETYLVLSPGMFKKEDRDWFQPGEGGSFYVPPNALHAMRSAKDAPLFAIWALWAQHEVIQ